MKTTFYVSLPDSTVLEVEVNPKSKAQECMDQVCRRLDILEQDYLGLQYRGSRGESLWLNLRNKLERQLVGPPPHRLQLRVKFYVQPHQLLQPSIKQLFFDQVKSELEAQKLVADSYDQLSYMVALIAQARYGNYDVRTHQLNTYKGLLEDIVSEPTTRLTQDITNQHRSLVGLTQESAKYKMLQEAASLQNYGVAYHEAMIGSEGVTVGVGPTGAFLYTGHNLVEQMELIEKLEYPMVTKAEHVGRNCVLKVMNDNGIERDITLRMPTQSAASAMYRCITEMHSFFCCDTVHDEVSTQYSRDLKGTLASLFNEKTTLGLDYVFDIKRTSREAHDHARRILYQPPQGQGSPGEETSESATDCRACMEGSDSIMQEKCQELEDTLDQIQDAFLCCVCRDMEISTTLCPCGHMTCMDCAPRLTECPLCREPVERLQRVFLPMLRTAEKGAGGCATSVSLKRDMSPSHKRMYRGHERTVEAMDFASEQ